MRARLLLCATVAGAVALSGCTNDYDQFDFGIGGEGGIPHDGAIEADRSVAGGQAGQGGQGPGGQGGRAGDDAQGGGGTPSDGPSDVIAQDDAPLTNDATDAPSAPDVADVRSEADASRDVSAEPDAGLPDVSLDVRPDISPDVVPERDAAIDVQDASLDVGSDVSDAPPCAPGNKLCGATCVPTNDPATGCAAASCNPCSFANASATCGDGGACALGACNNGFLDCDGVAGNGCEVTQATNIDNCGQCGRACSTLHTISRRCVGGLCVPSCALGFDTCVSPAAPLADDGCERGATNASCGSCSNDCSVQGATPFSCLIAGSSALCGCVANMSCGGAAGICSAGQCTCGGATCHMGETCLSVVVDAGTGGGGGNADAGADSGDDAASDGGSAADADNEAGTEAGGGTVVVDFCACNGASACGPTETCCPAPLGCHDLQIEAANCGACGRQCLPGFACVAGVCQCNSNGDCNGGTTGTCTAATGQCTCSGSVCNRGERCQVGGTCG